jgi:hypothetical protein
VVDEVRDGRDGGARHELLHEHDAAPVRQVPLGVGHVAAHVEAEVQFLEVAVEGDGDAQHPRVEEEEPHDADPAAPVVEVELGAGGHAIAQKRRVDRVVEHHEVAPLGGEERGHRASARVPDVSRPSPRASQGTG